ncbi:hypothetical protein VWZ88_16005 [Phaeobacter sp. JH20_36]|uniref:hypothetical protein n=1 Tax=unclassified Phaeobacter TaxID=2621772 RepID=UPI003A8BD090
MNRSDLIDQLSVSVNQAPIDVNRYINFALPSILYDKSARTYVCGTNFKPLRIEPDASKDLAQLRPNADGILNREDSWIANLPQYADTPTPVRRFNPLTLFSAAGAIRQLEAQAKVTALDYGMRNGKERIKARQALLLYAAKAPRVRHRHGGPGTWGSADRPHQS